MNLLAQVFEDRGEVDRLAGEGDRIRLPDLYELPGDSSLRDVLPPTEFSERLEGPASSWVQEAYLELQTDEDWNRIVESAAETIDDAPEWVAFYPGSTDGPGIVLPDDAGPRPSVSLFADIEGTTRRLSIAPGENGQVEVDVSLDPHCQLSPTGSCPDAACGECRLVFLIVRGGHCCVCEH